VLASAASAGVVIVGLLSTAARRLNLPEWLQRSSFATVLMLSPWPGAAFGMLALVQARGTWLGAVRDEPTWPVLILCAIVSLTLPPLVLRFTYVGRQALRAAGR